MSIHIEYLDSPLRYCTNCNNPLFAVRAVRAQGYCNNCKNPFRGLQLQQCATNYLLLNNRFVFAHACSDSGFATIVDLLHILTGGIYSNFPLAAEARIDMAPGSHSHQREKIWWEIPYPSTYGGNGQDRRWYLPLHHERAIAP